MNHCEAVGKVSKLFGQGGELIINLYENFPATIDFKEPLFVSIDSLTVPIFFDKFERRGVSNALVRFADFDTVKRASELLNLELSIASSALDLDEDEDDSEQDGIYLDDMVGFEARFKNNNLKGVITDFIDNGMNPLFEIEIDGRSVFVPAADDLIVSYSKRRKSVKFLLPDGLLEL